MFSNVRFVFQYIVEDGSCIFESINRFENSIYRTNRDPKSAGLANQYYLVLKYVELALQYFRFHNSSYQSRMFHVYM